MVEKVRLELDYRIIDVCQVTNGEHIEHLPLVKSTLKCPLHNDDTIDCFLFIKTIAL